MSDRKTTEIKLRLSPGEKTSWQLAAEQREVGLSQFIRDCVQESIWVPTTLQSHAVVGDKAFDMNTGEQIAVTASSEAQTSDAQDDEDSSIEQAVPTSGDVDLVTSPRKSWMFEGTNGG